MLSENLERTEHYRAAQLALGNTDERLMYDLDDAPYEVYKAWVDLVMALFNGDYE